MLNNSLNQKKKRRWNKNKHWSLDASFLFVTLCFIFLNFVQVDGPVRKLLKGGKDLDDTLIAAVIRNLKAVQVQPYVLRHLI
jgi:hypothetical protein